MISVSLTTERVILIFRFIPLQEKSCCQDAKKNRCNAPSPASPSALRIYCISPNKHLHAAGLAEEQGVPTLSRSNEKDLRVHGRRAEVGNLHRAIGWGLQRWGFGTVLVVGAFPVLWQGEVVGVGTSLMLHCTEVVAAGDSPMLQHKAAVVLGARS